MSADNWAVCPRCFRRERERIANLQLRMHDAYGKVPIEEFDALRAEAEKDIDVQALRTFREDYEQGIDGHGDGEFFVRYHGQCTVCALSHEFEHDDVLRIDAPGSKANA